jgi:cell division protein FtsL
VTRRGTLIVLIGLAIAVGATGIEVARIAHKVRALHADLERARQGQDELMSEHSRLLLERSAIAAYQNVERIAADRLAMQFPSQVEYLSR